VSTRDPDPVADELAVRNVISALARTADGDDVDAYIALFAPDATWELPEGVRRGHSDLRAGSLERRASGTIGPGSGTRHVVTTTVVELSGDRAVAHSTWMFLADTATSPRIARVGTYADELVRADARWVLQRRVVDYG